ncbi:MAG: hypothetical protein AABW81_04000, partial [Nanoarchaeota archaeon]
MARKKSMKKNLVLNKLNKLEEEIKDIEKAEEKNTKEEKKIEEEQKKIERTLFNLGRFTFKRKHFLELIRGTAGAFLGVGLGMNLLNTKNLAVNLPWINVIGILAFILTISALLIYKNQRDFVKSEGKKIIVNYHGLKPVAYVVKNQT